MLPLNITLIEANTIFKNLVAVRCGSSLFFVHTESCIVNMVSIANSAIKSCLRVGNEKGTE